MQERTCTACCNCQTMLTVVPHIKRFPRCYCTSCEGALCVECREKCKPDGECDKCKLDAILNRANQQIETGDEIQ